MLINWHLDNSNVVNSNCTDYDVQLVDGTADNNGQLLVCLNGVWGGVCNKYINSLDISLLCKKMGYNTGQCTFCLHW